MSHAIEVDSRLNGDEVLDRIKRSRGALPEYIRVDNGSKYKG